MFKIGTSVAVLLLAPQALYAQDASAAPAHKSAFQLVQEYRTGVTKPARALITLPCPANNPSADSVIASVLELSQAPTRVADLSVGLAAVIAVCNDERVDEWFRKSLPSSAGLFPALHLVNGLLSHPIPDNVQAVKSFAMNASRSGDLQTHIYEAMIAKLSLNLRERVELFAEVYETSGELPQPYAALESHNLRKGPEANYWRLRLLASLKNFPGNKGSSALLHSLGHDAFESGDTAWRARFQSALDELMIDPRSESSLKNDIRAAKALLARDRRSGK